MRTIEGFLGQRGVLLARKLLEVLDVLQVRQMRLALGVQELQTLVVCAAIVANLLEKLESMPDSLVSLVMACVSSFRTDSGSFSPSTMDFASVFFQLKLQFSCSNKSSKQLD